MKLKYSLLAASLVLNAAAWLVALLIFPRESPAAILHYSSDTGIDFVGEGSDISTLPVIGSLLIAINYGVGLGLKRLDERLYWLLVAPVPLMQLTLLAALAALWYVNR